jgi:DNA-binding MarR family transcriptional regulator
MSSSVDRRQAMDQVVDVVRRLRALADTATERRGLTPARASVLVTLHREGSLTGVDLAKRLEVTPRNVTALVDALEAQDLVSRRPHPGDRRAQLVALTRSGRTVAAGMARGYERMTETLLAGFSERDLADLERVAGLLALALDQYPPASRGG